MCGIPVCIGCQVEMVCVKNDQLVRDVACRSMPAMYWIVDRWTCPECNVDLIIRRRNPGFDWDRIRRMGYEPNDALTFAYHPQQKRDYPDQFGVKP